MDFPRDGAIFCHGVNFYSEGKSEGADALPFHVLHMTAGGVMYTKTNARVSGSNSQLSLFVPHVGTSLPTRTRLKKSQCIDPTWSLKLTPAFYNLGPTMALSSPQLFKVPVIGGTIF